MKRELDKREMWLSLVVSVAPIVIMILATKPALRQSIKMRAALVARDFCVRQTEFWQSASFTAARWYSRTRL